VSLWYKLLQQHTSFATVLLIHPFSEHKCKRTMANRNYRMVHIQNSYAHSSCLSGQKAMLNTIFGLIEDLF